MKTDDDSILNAIIIACIIGIAVVLFLIVTTDKDEGFTELYLLDYDKTPLSGVISIKYGINNHENMDVDYNLVVMIDDNIVSSKNITIADNSTHTDNLYLPFTETGTHKIMIKLEGREEEVHFWTRE